jgi:RecJ-like exonuclease
MPKRESVVGGERVHVRLSDGLRNSKMGPPIECHNSVGRSVRGNKKKVQVMQEFMAKGFCGACRGEGSVTAVDHTKEYRGRGTIVMTKRQCEGCDGTGKYPPKTK